MLGSRPLFTHVNIVTTQRKGKYRERERDGERREGRGRGSWQEYSDGQQ